MEDAIVAEVNSLLCQAHDIWPETRQAKLSGVEFFDGCASAGWVWLAMDESEAIEFKLKFNIDYACAYGIHVFKDTIIHELGHVICAVLYPGASRVHGKEFFEVCNALGGSGSEHHSYDPAYTLAC
jgi:predicted SprT family Zn-dependent metalloprotease